jgi:Glycosyl hydrolase-like 10
MIKIKCCNYTLNFLLVRLTMNRQCNNEFTATLISILFILLFRDAFKFNKEIGFQIKPEILEATIPTTTNDNKIPYLTPCQSSTGKSTTMYITSHGQMAHYPENEIKYETESLSEMGITNIAVSYLFRGKYLSPNQNPIFKSYKHIQKRNIFKEIKTNSKGRMCTTAFLEWGTQIPTKDKLNPEYLLKDKEGKTVFHANGVQTSYLNVLNPIVRKSILDMVENIAKTEGVDAIELDDHFAIENSFGYNKEFIELYNLAGGYGVPDENDNKFKAVRIKVLHDLMADIITVAKTANPKMKINIMSLSLDFMKSKYNQDYGKMVKLGLSDVGVEVYGRTVPAITSQVQKLDKKTTVSLLLGLGDELIPTATTNESILVLKQKGFTDLAFWGSNSVLYGPYGTKRRTEIATVLKKW